MTKVLIATLGLSPGVVTGAYFALTREGHEIDRVITVTTSGAHAVLCANMIAETLETADPKPEYEPLQPVNSQDLRSAKAAELFRDAVLAQLKQYGSQGDHIFLVLTGGRTSMAAAVMLAADRFLLGQPKAAERLTLYHLEVIDPELEERGTLRYLSGMGEEERRYYLNPPDTALKLVQLPDLTSGRLPKAHQARLFEYATGAYMLENLGYEQLRFSFFPDYLHQPGLGEVDVYAEKFVEGAIGDVEKVDFPQLRGLLTQTFDLEELKTLCADLGVPADEFPPTLTPLARELVAYLMRRQRIVELIELCERERPRYPWRDTIHLREVLLCECKLRTGEDPRWKPITVDVVEKLARKMKAVAEETKRPVAGWVVSNTPYAESAALDAAGRSGIALHQAILPDNWKKRVDWHISALQPISLAPEN